MKCRAAAWLTRQGALLTTEERLWGSLGSWTLALAILAFSVTIRGEWLLLGFHIMRQLGSVNRPQDIVQPDPLFSWGNVTLKDLYLEGFPMTWTICNIWGFSMYFFIGGFLHWQFYVKRRHCPEEWKCQPSKWLPWHLQLHEIMFGCFSLLTVNTVTALFGCYLDNGGWSMVYYRPDEYSWLWFFLQWPAIFCYQDYGTYWMHRLYHTPWMYRHFHKAHHKYIQPTAFSVTAIHPVEIVHIQLMLFVPLFTVPTHWSSFTVIGLYTYYNGIIDHSGVDFKAPWWQPWRPDTIFHDNHHLYFHVNFGFNCYFWDKLHGTYRREDRIYKEDIFYGKGKPLCEASSQEVEEDISKRLSENPRAHRHINHLPRHLRQLATKQD